MKAARYLITKTVDGRNRTEIWESGRPYAIDHPIRWVLEQTPDGVRIRSLAHAPYEMAQHASIRLQTAQLEQGSKVRLIQEQDQSRPPVQLQIRKIQEPAPIFASVRRPKGTRSTDPTEIKVYQTIGTWVLETRPFEGHYVGSFREEQLFEVEGPKDGSGNSRIRALRDGLELKLEAQTVSLRSGEMREIPAENGGEFSVRLRSEQVSRENLVHPDVLWIFRRSARWAAVPKFQDALDPDTKTFRFTALAMLVFFLVASLILSTLPKDFFRREPEISPQIVKLILQRPILATPKQQLKIERPTSRAEQIQMESQKELEQKALSQKEAEKPLVPLDQSEAAQQAEVKPSEKESVLPDRPTEASKGKVEKPDFKAPIATRARTVPELAKSSKPVLKEAEAPKPSERLMALNSLMSKTMSGGVEKLLNEKSVIDTAKAQPMGKVSLEARAQALSNYDVALNSGNAVTIVQGLGGSNDREVGAGISGGNSVGYGKGEKPQLASIGKSNITLDAGMASVEQGLTKEEVGAVIERHKSEIRYCYEAAMLREPRVEGRISLAFTIDKAGRVVKAGVANSSVNDPRLAQCLLARLPNWKFPNPKGGVSVDVSYPFVFKTLGGA